MGSSTNGVTRGQLRPYIGSRGPPFIICGLFVFLIIVGYSYWNLSYRFNILHKDCINLEEKLRLSATRNDHLTKENEAKGEKLQRDETEIEKAKALLTKKDDELQSVFNQLRSKEDELGRLNSQIEVLKPEVDKYKQAHDEVKAVKDQLEDEVKQLKDKNTALEQVVNDMRNNDKQPEKSQEPAKKRSVLNPLVNSLPKNMEKSNAINKEKLKAEPEQKNGISLDPNLYVPSNIEQDTV